MPEVTITLSVAEAKAVRQVVNAMRSNLIIAASLATSVENVAFDDAAQPVHALLERSMKAIDTGLAVTRNARAVALDLARNTGYAADQDAYVAGFMHDRAACPPIVGPARSAYTAGWITGNLHLHGEAAQRVRNAAEVLGPDIVDDPDTAVERIADAIAGPA